MRTERKIDKLQQWPAKRVPKKHAGRTVRN